MSKLNGSDSDSGLDDAPVAQLGFLEKPEEEWHLHRTMFPNKVGGKPAWLNVRDLPIGVVCESCKKQLSFLLQIYAPFSDFEQSFHRSLFVFCCKSSRCFTRSPTSCVRVFRSQLPQENPFYPPEAPTFEDGEKVDEQDIPKESIEDPIWEKIYLCAVCGFRGKSRCGTCQKVYYCSKEHQHHHWHQGHSLRCQKEETKQDSEHQPPVIENSNQPQKALQKPNTKSSKRRKRRVKKKKKQKQIIPVTFPEYEIIMQAENEDEDEENKQDPFEKENALLKKYERNLKKMSQQEQDEMDSGLGDDGKAVDSVPSDTFYEAFKNTISKNPEQCIRYAVDAENTQPLWVGKQRRLEASAVPVCQKCQQPRLFEFQIMPQLLYYLEVDKYYGIDAIDWGTLVIYTCKNSCGNGLTDGYFEEFIHYQPSISPIDYSTLKRYDAQNVNKS